MNVQPTKAGKYGPETVGNTPRSWPAILINDASGYAKGGTLDGESHGRRSENRAAPKKTPISANIGKRLLVFHQRVGGRTEWR